MNAASGRATDDNGRGRIPKVVALGDEIRDLVESADDEIDELHFGNGTQAEIAHPARRADNGALTDGRIDDALPAKALKQAFAGLESAAVHTDILTEENNGRVPLHFLEHGLPDSFEESDLGRRAVVGRSASIWLAAGHAYPRFPLLSARERSAPRVKGAVTFADFLPADLAGASAASFSSLAGAAGAAVSPK